MNTDMLNRLKAGNAETMSTGYAEVTPQLIFTANPNREGFIITNKNNGADLEVIFVSVVNDDETEPASLPTIPSIVIPPLSAYETGLLVFTGTIYGAYTSASGDNSQGFNATELSK